MEPAAVCCLGLIGHTDEPHAAHLNQDKNNSNI
jgi:hypothetical protein